ncbi:FAD-dependent monooxygenase [Streptomyces sp. NPDC048483]|uniref:FAD-dependent monooxygenase n=1 Tax=Streptomyces sp. NPDC048483 TaxID=3154927 RepID=UPI00342BEF9B
MKPPVVTPSSSGSGTCPGQPPHSSPEDAPKPAPAGRSSSAVRPSAVVIGGGIGGLATAIALRSDGWQVDVLERADAAPPAGTALGLWPSALAALDALGIGTAVRNLGRPQTGGAFLRPDGRRIAVLDVAGLARRTGDAVHLLSRPALLGLLHDAAGPGAVRFGAPVDGGRLPALEAAYDLVIAADGLNSRARTALFGPAYRAVYAGATGWRGTVTGDIGTYTETWGEGRRFGITPQEGGRTNWFAAAPEPPGARSPDGEPAALRARFGHWHAAVRDILDRLEEGEVLRHDLYHLDLPLPRYFSGRTVLLGDAAHAMTPDLGRGACEALLDAVELASALRAAPDIPSALRAYDAKRRPATQRLARTARAMNRMARVRRCTGARNAVLRAALTIGGPPP